MSVELLTIVNAEQQAEQLVQQALEHKEAAIKAAMEERQFKLSNLKGPQPKIPEVRSRKPDVESLKETAKRNKAKAVSKILEEFYAAS